MFSLLQNYFPFKTFWITVLTSFQTPSFSLFLSRNGVEAMIKENVLVLIDDSNNCRMSKKLLVVPPLQKKFAIWICSGSISPTLTHTSHTDKNYKFIEYNLTLHRGDFFIRNAHGGCAASILVRLFLSFTVDSDRDASKDIISGMIFCLPLWTVAESKN